MKTEEIKEVMKDQLIQYYKEGRWKDILEMFKIQNGECNGYFYDERYLWVRPNADNLEFIKQHTLKNGCSQLVSIGCGSGLLEWLIFQATGLEVFGVEVDRAWWESSYAAPTFLPLVYADEENGKEDIINENSALLFCYFNDGTAFNKYINKYKGNCFFIIGPGDGRGTHTCPAPFDVQLEKWQIEAFQELQNTKDFIAVYTKS